VAGGSVGGAVVGRGVVAGSAPGGSTTGTVTRSVALGTGSGADVTGVGAVVVAGALATYVVDVVVADGSAVSVPFGSATAAPTPPSAMQKATQ
jgi:hypothetical protein